MRKAAVAALAAALAIPAAAQETDTDSPERRFQLFGSTSTLYELNQTQEDDPDAGEYSKLKEVLTLNLAWSDFTVGVQAQYLYYSDLELVDPLDLDRVYDGFDLRKYYLEYLKDRVSFRLGTFYTSLGHGLTLYVQKNETLGFDEPVHGGTGTLNLGPVEVTALGGRVSDPVLQARFGRTIEDTVYAGHAAVRLPGDFYLGGSYVAATLESVYAGFDDDQVDIWAAEGGGYAIAGFLDAHAEWAEVDKVEREREKEGYGRYLSLSSGFGPITLLGEWKDYWNFSYRYNNPPTAGQTEEFYDHNDVKGGRLKVGADVAATGTLLAVSYGEFDSHREPSSLGGVGGDAQAEWYFGIQETYRRLYLEASYFDRDFEDRGIAEQHTLADVHLTVGSRGDVSAGYDARLEEAAYFETTRTRTHLTYTWARLGAIGVRYAWTERSNNPTEEFWGGEVQYLPTEAWTLALFVGSDPGGLVCSGGQCREEPPFKGVRAEVEWRF